MNTSFRSFAILAAVALTMPVMLLAIYPSAQAEEASVPPALPTPSMGMNSPAFADFDANADGCINAAEFAAGWGNRRAGNGVGNSNMPAFADFDADKDGYISETELNTGRAQRISEQAADGRQLKNVANAAPFADIDTSKDGKIDPAEFAAHQASHRQPAKP